MVSLMWKVFFRISEMCIRDRSVRAPEAEDDYEMQNILIEQAISEHPDAIVLTPASYTETTPLARKIVDSGIRLLLLDSEINEDVEECIISTDNIKAGQLQGSYVREDVYKRQE